MESCESSIELSGVSGEDALDRMSISLNEHSLRHFLKRKKNQYTCSCIHLFY